MATEKSQRKTGKSLELLVFHLEEALASNPNVVIEKHKRVRDLTNGKLREHDVYITFKENHHVMVLAIECRDLSRKITVNQVEGFWKKCQDTSIDQGVIVSSKGFYDSAKEKAKFLKIGCFGLEEAISLNWLLCKTFRVSHRNVINTSFVIYLKDNLKDFRIQDYVFVDNQGTAFKNNNILTSLSTPFDELANEFEQKANVERDAIGLPNNGTEFIFPLIVDGEGIFLKNINTQEIVSINYITVKVTYSIVAQDVPITTLAYSNESNNDLIASAAIINYSYNFRGDKKEKLMLVRTAENTLRVVLMPDK